MNDKKQSNMESKGKNIPKLRFPGFEGEWEVKKLGEVASFKRGMTITQNDVVPGDIPVIAGGKTPSYYHNISNRTGQTIAISGSGAYSGFVSFWEKPVFLSDSFSVEPDLAKLLKKYVYYYLSHIQVFLYSLQKGAGVPHVHGSEVGEITIPFPTLPEQQKIASCLSSLDGQISAEQSRLESLSQHKRGLMQQLFPQEGETVPKLRFPGFEGEWEVKKIGDLGKIITGSTPSKDHPEYWNGDFCWVSARDMKDKYVYDTAEKVTDAGKKLCRILPPNSVLVTCIASIGLNAIAKVPCATNQQINSISFSTKSEAEFFYQSIERASARLKEYAGINAVPIINKQKFAEFEILFPPTLPEQQKIASCLTAIDNLIAAQQERIEALKQHKRGLMQQLFPAVANE